MLTCSTESALSRNKFLGDIWGSMHGRENPLTSIVDEIVILDGFFELSWSIIYKENREKWINGLKIIPRKVNNV